MILKIIDEKFSVCRIGDPAAAVFADTYCFLCKTDEEISLVCPTSSVPGHTLAREDGWRAFRIEGVLDFSLIGILAGISGILAENKIGIFVVILILIFLRFISIVSIISTSIKVFSAVLLT